MKVQGKSQDCCVTFISEKYLKLFCFLHMHELLEADILQLDYERR